MKCYITQCLRISAFYYEIRVLVFLFSCECCRLSYRVQPHLLLYFSRAGFLPSLLICTKTIHESLCYENTFLCGFRYEINDLARTGFCHNTVIMSFSFIHFPGGTIMHLDLSVKFLTIRQIIMFRWIADI